MGPELFAVIAGMVGVTLIAGSRLRARRRRTARTAATGWAPAVAGGAATFATAAPATRWGESRSGADFDEWHEDDAPPARGTAPDAAGSPPAVVAPEDPGGPSGGAPFTLEPDLDELDDDDLDDVFAGREPARESHGRFAQPPAPAPLVPDGRGIFGEVAPPRGGAAGFRTAPRRTGLRGLLGSPAVRAAAYAAAGIALVALIVNLALAGGESQPAAERKPAPAVPTTQAPPPEPAGPTPAEIAAQRDAAAAASTDAVAAAAAAERRARAAERRAIRRRRAAAARRRREAIEARRRAPQQPVAPAAPAAPQPAVPAPSAPRGGGGGGGGGGGSNPPCELGCIG